MATALRINRARIELEIAKREWTQTRFAQLCDVSQPTMSQFLAGKFDAPRLAARAARVLGLQLEDITTFEVSA